MVRLFNSRLTFTRFLAEYWQQKPLLLRGAFADLTPPLTADELAGLACETGSNARLVLEHCGDRRWCVEYGPFDERRFAELPDSGWSLLVSDVERMVPEARQLQQQFRFVPDWRLDDVMISYAPAGGSVGAHTDAYDVFLLQLEGTRRWQIAEHFDTTVLDDTDLEILANFEAEQDWLLEPGDMLYLPPGAAHHGIAENACMTCSIGFRAPSSHDMAPALLDHLLQQHGDRRYRDAGMSLPSHAAEISAQSLAQIRQLLQSVLHFDDTMLADWFGRYISDSKSQFDQADELFQETESIDTLLQDQPLAQIEQHPDCRFFFIRHTQGAQLFVNGEVFDISLVLAETLCADIHQPLKTLISTCQNEQDKACLLHCLKQQWLLLIP